MVGLKLQVLSSFALYIGKDQEGLICLPSAVGSLVVCIIDVRYYVSVVEEFSGIDVDDMLQLRKKNQLLFFGMLLHMCSIWACHQNVLSTMSPSWRCSVTFSVF